MCCVAIVKGIGFFAAHALLVACVNDDLWGFSRFLLCFINDNVKNMVSKDKQ